MLRCGALFLWRWFGVQDARSVSLQLEYTAPFHLDLNQQTKVKYYIVVKDLHTSSIKYFHKNPAPTASSFYFEGLKDQSPYNNNLFPDKTSDTKGLLHPVSVNHCEVAVLDLYVFFILGRITFPV